MSFKIKRLKIENFKVFKSKVIEVESENLSLLDGPNGFGKTTFYDALELLFLGKVQRYIDIDNNASNKQKLLGTFPLLHNETMPQDELSIQAKIETPGNTIYLKRSAPKKNLMKLRRVEHAHFELYKFEKSEWVKIQNEVDFITNILGVNYRQNYGLFHYIEQEENTALLKSTGVSKQNKIDHLFDVGDYREKINKLEKIKASIQSLKKPAKERDLIEKENKIKRLKSEAHPENHEKTDYKRIIFITEQPWDLENPSFDSGTYSDWVSDNGDIASIKSLVRNKSEFLNSRYNNDIDQKLKLKQPVLESLLMYAHRLDSINKYKDDISVHESAIKYLDNSKKGTVFILEKNLETPDESIIHIVSENINIQDFKEQSKDLKELLSTSNEIEKNLAKVVETRKQLLIDLNEYQKNITPANSVCPTCGHDWIKHDLLLKGFEKQAKSLDSLMKSLNNELQQKIKTFELEFIQKINEACKQIINTEKNNINYKKAISKLSEEKVNTLKKLKNNFSNYNINLSPLYIKDYNIQPPSTQTVIDEINKLYKSVNKNLLLENFNDLFTSIFNNNEDALNNTSEADFKEKEKYLRQKFSESRLKEIKTKEEQYKNDKEQYEMAVKVDGDLKSLIKLYTNNVNQYIESISKGIEILFHIYSGRLLQNFQNGLGVFIETDGASISFKDTPQAKHDVIFSMSSGQLSSLVIAFTMALNHKYSQNPLLLIDDPVQTMDEINVAGFIDLLRHEFKNKQIFVSTHEDHTSSYFRYKFRKAKLDAKRINFKALSKNA